ncbi:MAG: class I SAM-dependent methyltransferase [Betaproteobacteria bacterium]|nr:class I SAM-dependent methyltransferase [Betaproteobacteria bacterium]
MPAVQPRARHAHPAVVLKPGREKSLLRRHPWIFSGAIGAVADDLQSGDSVEVRSSQGQFLAWAAYSPTSQIRCRVWSFEKAEVPGPELFRRRLQTAFSLRRALLPAAAVDALRLVHGESDGLPGLVVDRYADTLVVQILAAGCERWRAALVELLGELSGCAQIYERSDTETRELEGLPRRAGPLSGAAPSGPVEITEYGLHFLIDPASGQKTGFFLDQRANRQRIRALFAEREVLDCFCYSGGFSLAALAGGARSVVSVDSSASALALAQRNLLASGLEAARVSWIEADVFRFLREMHAKGRNFDAIVLDPPKFAPTQRHAQAASRAYKDINLFAFKLLRPGGLLATFSCSGGVSADLFQKIVAGAAADAAVSASILERFQAASDHPLLLEFPEGEYLKGLLLRRN